MASMRAIVWRFCLHGGRAAVAGDGHGAEAQAAPEGAEREGEVRLRIVDLAWPLEEGMPGHPLHPVAPRLLSGTLSHTLTRRWMGEHPVFGRVSFANEQIVMSGHVGTHVDAPLHALPGGPDANAIDLADCVGPASRLDVRRLCGPRATIGGADLEKALSPRHRPAAIVLLHTGWSGRALTEPDDYYRNSMGLDESGVAWIRERGARCVGIDAPSIDTPDTPGAPAHMDFLRGSPPIYVIENLRGLEALPDEIPLFVGAPLPIKGASGSPIRAIAILDLDS